VIQLHYFPGNASLAPHMLLEELGVPFELRLVDRTREAQRSPEYLKLNPNGTIPVLVDGDLVLYETAAICLYLIDTHPEGGLAPAVGTPERAHFYKWLVWMTNTLQATLLIWHYPDRWADTAATAAEVKARAEAKIGGMLDQLDAELARHGRAWLLGERFSALDPYALMLGRWTRAFARPARSLPRLGPYLERVLARPAVARVFEREGLVAPRA
jgi:glutathione S-transferase